MTPHLKTVQILALSLLCMLMTACVGSDTPRRPIRQKNRAKVYVPPINPELLVPSSIKKSNLDFYKQRAALQTALDNRDENPWRATDRDIKRIDAMLNDKSE